MARLLVRATPPHKNPGDTVSTFERSNGNLHLVVMAPPRIGLPWGKTPRLLLSWLSTEAVRKGSRRIELGGSLSAFMRELGLLPTGGRWGAITRLRDQVRRLFTSTIRCSYDGPGRFEEAGSLPASRRIGWHLICHGRGEYGRVVMAGSFRRTERHPAGRLMLTASARENVASPQQTQTEMPVWQ